MKSISIIIVVLILISCKKKNIESSDSLIIINSDQKTELKSKITNSIFEEKNIFGNWTTNLNGPHADFEITEKLFYIVDYDGDGAKPYEINENKIKIFYPSFEKTGLITKAKNDSLIIYWASGEHITYRRWNQ